MVCNIIWSIVKCAKGSVVTCHSVQDKQYTNHIKVCLCVVMFVTLKTPNTTISLVTCKLLHWC